MAALPSLDKVQVISENGVDWKKIIKYSAFPLKRNKKTNWR